MKTKDRSVKLDGVKFDRETRKLAKSFGIGPKTLPSIYRRALENRLGAMSHVRTVFGTGLGEAKKLVDLLVPPKIEAAYVDPLTQTPVACLRDGVLLAQKVGQCWAKGDLATTVRALHIWASRGQIVVGQNGGYAR